MKSLYQNPGFSFIRIILISIGFLSLSFHANAQYCGASGTYFDEYIDSVKIGTIENSSSWTGYQDFTHLCTDLVAGQNYPITVLNPSAWSSDRCDVWIDWNQDSDFYDSYEYYYLNTTVSPFFGEISVPTSTPIGKTRMRIRVRYNGIVDPCGDADQNWGEVEDYSVRVVPNYNMNYVSSTCLQLDDPVVRGTSNQSILKVVVITDGGVNPVDLTDFQCYTTGTTNPSDIIYAKMYYTGNSNSFNTDNQFGYTSNSPNGYFTFMGTQTLVHDTNYFWLTYDIDPNATIGNFMDAVVTVHTIGGVVEFTTVSDPPGAREIVGSGIITIDSDSVEVTINACGDSTQYSLVVKNTGTENLNWICDLTNIQYNNALHFDGDDDFIDVAFSSVPTGNFHYTIEGWTYYETTSYGVVVGWGDHYGNYDEVNILAMDDDWVYNYWYDNYLEIETFGHINNWHHVAVTYDGSMRYMYLDGKFIGAKYGNTLNVPYNNNFLIGDDGFNSYFTGFMDELRIWDHALTQEEILTNMHFSPPLDTSGLVNRWSFDEGTGNTTTDMSVNGDIGNINGASWTHFNPYSYFLSGDINSG